MKNNDDFVDLLIEGNIEKKKRIEELEKEVNDKASYILLLMENIATHLEFLNISGNEKKYKRFIEMKMKIKGER